MTIENLKIKFEEKFHKPAERIFFCPGRVNLIGEHIDYNGGVVMPCAVTMGTTLLVAKNNDTVFRFQSMDFSETADVTIQNTYIKVGEEWFNYALGVIDEFTKAGINPTGLDLLYSGNLPIGSGLSSSASIEVLTAHALNEMFSGGMGHVDVAILGKKVENIFMGLNSGIMDQFAVAMGKESNAILLNCDTLEYEYLPFDIGDYVLAIINTNKPRKLVASKYNERFNECRNALKALQKKLDIKNLCEAGVDDFNENKNLINDAVIENRALHVISENQRVKDAKRALVAGDLEKFGELMYASHDSLQHLYEVSGKELDTIVDFCKTYQGCIGARMTGAGFGGCAIALIEKGRFDDFAEKISNHYNSMIGYKPTIFSSVVAEGVRTII